MSFVSKPVSLLMATAEWGGVWVSLRSLNGGDNNKVNTYGFTSFPSPCLGMHTIKLDKLNILVYFLGGMGIKDLDKTLELGAQGIAGVSAF
jgi:hypothetical protein